MTYASRKTLLATISPTPYDKPLLLDLVTPAPHRFFLGVALSGVSLVGSGGAGAPYSYSIISGSLPTGLSLNGSTGAITGTPTVQGAVSFVAEVQDSASNVFDHSLTINIEAALGVLQGGSQPPPGRRDVAYRFAFLVADLTGSTAGITYSVTTGSAPSGLSLSSAGVLSGTPTAGAVGTTTFTVTATKTGAGSLAIPVTMVVLDRMTSGTLTVPNELRFMTKGVPVSAYLTLTSLTSTTTAALVFSIASGALPSGLTMDAFGLVSGTPDTVTLSTYTQPTIRVTDPNTQGYIDFTLTAPNTFNVATRLKVSAGISGTSFVTVDDTGTTSTSDYLANYFGDGSDGNVTISSGTTALSADAYYDTLTISGTGKLFTNGYTVYCKTLLDLTNAGASAIFVGASSSILPNTVSKTAAHYGADGGAGVAGATGAGTIGNTGSGPIVGTGTGGQAGSGGSGSSGAGGSVTVAKSPTYVPNTPPKSVLSNALVSVFAGIVPTITANGVYPLGGGAGGGSGGSGGGNGIAAGGASGDGGGGGGRLRICARNIARSGSTAARAIDARGFKGANGTAGGGSGRGGGGAGAGGGGGFADITHAGLTGSTATNAIDASGGDGGNGGAAGGGTSSVGQGGDGGYSGMIVVRDLIAGTTTVVNITPSSGHSGSTGSVGGTAQANL